MYPCYICQTYIQICTLICTWYSQVHIGYALDISHMHIPVSACIGLYLYVSQDHRSCILCIYACMLDTFSAHTRRYIRIWTPEGSSYLHVSCCIFVMNTCKYALMHSVHIRMYQAVFRSWIHEDMHFWFWIHPHMHSAFSAYLYVSVCIFILDTCTYASAFVDQICIFYCAG